MKPTKYQLKNGLTVLLVESRKNPVLSVQMWVRTGSADESKAEAGISHFIEHLVFKGTRSFGVGEIASTVEGSGGELNAYTSFDQTVFHVTIAAAEAETALKVISEMMGHPKFDPIEVDREREVVIEEIKRGNDSPGRKNSQLLFSTSFKKHPYGRPVIGYEKVIRKVSVKTLKKYFQDRYSPKNMFLMVTGDFSKAEMKEKVQEHFGDFSPTPVRIVRRAKEVSRSARVKIEKASFKETHINLAWPIPSVTHADVPALDVFALILGQGDSSRLSQRMRYDEALVHGVGSSAFTPIDAGLFAINMTLDADQVSEALKAAGEELFRLLDSGPRPEELSKAIISLASDTIYSLETVDGIARSYGGMEFYLNDPLAYDKYLKKLSALKASDVIRVARKYLKPATLAATALSSEKPEQFKKEFASFKKSFFPKSKGKIAATKGKAIRLNARLGGSKETPIHRVSLPGGGILLLKHQPETPTTSFRMTLGGGLSVEPIGKDGLNELFSRIWTSGGKKFDEAEINKEIDSIAAGFGAFAGRNTVGLSADFISSFEDRIWAVIEDSVKFPMLPDAAFQRERDLLLRQIQMRKDHPSSVCMRAFSETLFAGHPYAKETHGTEKSLPDLSREDLLDLRRTITVQGNLSAAVVGDFDSDQWIDRMNDLAKSFEKGATLLKEIRHEGPREDVRIFNQLDKEQTHFMVGVKGLGLKDPRRWTLQVMQAILAGQGGRLFIELRDKKSLAYSVSPIQMEGLGTGSFGAYIACSPEKVDLAEKMIHEEFQKLVHHQVSEEEIARARKYLMGRTAIDLQRKSTTVSSILFDEIYGNSPEEGLHPEKKYAAVTAADIQALAQDLFSRPMVTSIVGPKKGANS